MVLVLKDHEEQLRLGIEKPDEAFGDSAALLWW